MPVIARHSLFAIPLLLQQTPITAVSEGENFAEINNDVSNADTETLPSQPPSSDELRVSSRFLCTSCLASFDSAEQQREHAKSPWHVNNVQRLSRGQPSISEEDFHSVGRSLRSPPIIDSERKCPNSDENDSDEKSDNEDSIKTIMGSTDSIDDDDDDDTHSKSNAAHLLFHLPGNKALIVTKSLLVHTRLTDWANAPFGVRTSHYLRELRHLSTVRDIAVILCLGGRFAAGIFDRDECVAHKAFVRYTTRKKQGGSQFSDDAANSGNKAKSIGSSIRRRETVRFIEQCREWLGQQLQQLRKCQLIFLYAPSFNRSIFYQSAVTPVTVRRCDGSEMIAEMDVSFGKDDRRVRSIPITVNRPTFQECQRVHRTLTTIEVTDEPNITIQPSIDIDITSDTLTAAQPQSKARAETPKMEVSDPLIDAIKTGDRQLVESLLSQPRDPALMPPVYAAVKYRQPALLEWLVNDRQQPVNASYLDATATSQAVYWTALHSACNSGSDSSMMMLKLLTLGADPTINDSRSFTAYQCIPPGDAGKDARHVMRTWAGQHSKAYDWSLANVVPIVPLNETEQEAKRQAAKEKEKAKRQRAKANKQLAKAEAAAEAEKQRVEEETDKQVRESKRAELERAMKGAAVMEQAYQSRQSTIATMSDREKRALAAEQRALALKGSAKRCAFCSQPITKVPFARLQFEYDTLDCLQKHRGQLEG